MAYSELREIFETVSDWEDERQSRECLTTFCHNMGFHFLSYHLMSPYGARERNDDLIIACPETIDVKLNSLQTIINNMHEVNDLDGLRKVGVSDEMLLEFFNSDQVTFKDIEFKAFPVVGAGARRGYFLIGNYPQSFISLSCMSPALTFMKAFHSEIVEHSQKRVMPLHKITPREREVLTLLVRGFTNTEIANLLSLSRFTVVGYLKAISLKLDVNNRVGLALAAISLGVV